LPQATWGQWPRSSAQQATTTLGPTTHQWLPHPHADQWEQVDPEPCLVEARVVANVLLSMHRGLPLPQSASGARARSGQGATRGGIGSRGVPLDGTKSIRVIFRNILDKKFVSIYEVVFDESEERAGCQTQQLPCDRLRIVKKSLYMSQLVDDKKTNYC